MKENKMTKRNEKLGYEKSILRYISVKILDFKTKKKIPGDFKKNYQTT